MALPCPSLCERVRERGRHREGGRAAAALQCPQGPLPACLHLTPSAHCCLWLNTKTSWLESQPCQTAKGRATVCGSYHPVTCILPIQPLLLLDNNTTPFIKKTTFSITVMALSTSPWTFPLALALPLALTALCWAPTPVLGGCPSACRCSFAMLQCLEPDGIASIPALAPQESENVTEM